MSVAGGNHRFSAEIAHEAQLRLSKQIIFEDRLPEKIHAVGGVDTAYEKGMSIGATAVLSYDSLTLVESQTSLTGTSVPYIPTLLSFREIPPTLMSIKKLTVQPDVFLVDGHGFAHPYRCGYASHLGLIIKRPTIGVAKGKLFGEVDSDETEKDVRLLKHDGEVIGAAIRTLPGREPIYVSLGHMVSLETAIKIVKHCTRGNRIPEPIMKAHELAAQEKRKIHIA
jgi:deoxyribonuclease V